MVKSKFSVGKKQTVVDWCNFIREVCEQHLEANPQELGGNGEGGGGGGGGWMITVSQSSLK